MQLWTWLKINGQRQCAVPVCIHAAIAIPFPKSTGFSTKIEKDHLGKAKLFEISHAMI